MAIQSKQSGTEVEQTVEQKKGGKVRRVGKSHVDYWKPRLKKRSYLGRNGKEIEISSWQVRVAHLGRREWFNLDTPNKDAAADKAQDIYLSLISGGWQATLTKFKPDMEIASGGATVGAFLRAVQDTGNLRLRTFLNYQNCFRTILAEALGVKSDKSRFDYRQGGNKAWTDRIDGHLLERLSPKQVDAWRKERVNTAGNSPVAIAAAQRTVNSYVRCARSLFSRDILKKIKGVQLPASDKLPFYEVELFANGSMKYVSKMNVKAVIAAARVELRDAKPEAYKVFLLGLFGGMRKGEIDLVEWRMVDWENHTIRLEETQWLHLKTQDSAGEITVDPEVIAELRGFMAASKSPFIIASNRPPRNDSAHAHYRCKLTFDELNKWLRGKGIKANKPLHEMRKEIGALIATEHGIYAASRFLRHSDITTTARHYAEHKARISVGLGKLLDTEIKATATQGAA